MPECMVSRPKPAAKRLNIEMRNLPQRRHKSYRDTHTDLPDRPWQRLAADMFTLKRKSYLLVADYYRFIEITNLSDIKAADITVHLKSMFTRHGLPEILVTENGLQSTYQTFAIFSLKCRFQHMTSSPKYPQSNGEAE